MTRASRTIRTLVLGSSLALLLGTTACVVPAPTPRVNEPAAPAPDLAETVTALVEAHNRVRAEHRRAPLAVSGPLEAAARRHALDMARRRRMSHRGGDGSSPFRRMAAEGYAFRHAGENVAAGYESVDSAMKGWMWSPGHRRNILGRYTEIGAACATATNGTIYWCVTFGTPLDQEWPSRASILGYAWCWTWALHQCPRMWDVPGLKGWTPMRGSCWLAIPLLAAVAVTGCQSGPSRHTLASAEPALSPSPSVDGGATVVEANPSQTVTFVDRHPLLSKSRDYFESSGDNKIVKSAAAVVVGIPAGIIGELKQIVVGTPQAPRY